MIYENYQQKSPGTFCEANHLVGPHVVLAHMVHLDEPVDIPILHRTKTHVVHNPTSNAKLGDSIAPIPKMLEQGVNVALGTDGAPCNNTYDWFRDLHLAGIIHCAKSRNASLMSAEQVLEMATINGAKALGLEQDIGSLEVGKKADFALVNPWKLGAAPYNWDEDETNNGISPLTVVVHSCTGSDVTMVVIDGETVFDKENGGVTGVNEEELQRDARRAIREIRERSGVNASRTKAGWKYI